MFYPNLRLLYHLLEYVDCSISSLGSQKCMQIYSQESLHLLNGSIYHIKIVDLRSRCFENSTYDLDVPISIPIDEEFGMDLKYIAIFYPMTLFLDLGTGGWWNPLLGVKVRAFLSLFFLSFYGKLNKKTTKNEALNP